MFNRFLAPAVSLMRRLGFTGKFALLWLTSLIAVAVVVFSLYASLDKEIRSSQRELEGVGLAAPVSRAVQRLQQHRGLSSGLLGGNDGMEAARSAREQEAQTAFAALEAVLPRNLRASEDWRLIRTDWALLREHGLRWSAEENFAAHTHLIERLLFFKVVVSGEYVLPLDPQVDTSYLIDVAINRLPLVLERLGQLRARGTVLLARKQASEPERVLIKALITQLGDDIRLLRISLERTGEYNAALRPALELAERDIVRLAQEIVSLADGEILSGRFGIGPDRFFAQTTAAIDKGYAQMYDTLLPAIESLIRARIADAESALRVSIGVAFALFLLTAYFSLGIYAATSRSIEALTRSARAFAGGDLGARVALGAGDDLRQVGDSFNEMADGFTALLAAREADESRLRAIFETSMDAVVQMNLNGVITGWNQQAAAMFGWSPEEALGRMLHETIIPPRYRDAHLQGMRRFLDSERGVAVGSRIEMVGLRRDGSEFPVELSITAFRAGGEYEFNGFIRDITQRKEAEALIWKQANVDPLTGLPNRHMFDDRLEQEIRKAGRKALPIALMFIDLDRFKEVNDTLGHSMGDQLLIEAGRRIAACLRESDTVARFGGDEFIVMLPGLDNPGRVDRIAEAILGRMLEPFRLDGKPVYLSASIGITLYPNDAADREALLKAADQAMYVAKSQGRNRFSYFTAELQERAQYRLRLLNELRGALATGQFEVHYQPIVELGSGRVHKAEALIRWRHPQRGLVAPGEFIGLAEETGLIVDIGDWLFHEVVRQVARWRTVFDVDFQVSVNKSPIQFRYEGEPSTDWPDVLRSCGVPGNGVVIEITESLLLDAAPAVVAKLSACRRVGMQVALDDFGTGYSSLAYLKRFDIDYLKIDQSFVRDLAIDADDMAVSEAIIVMAHKLGLRVIAEGVETEAQRQFLLAAGCDYAQGFLYSPAVPADAFEALLTMWRGGGGPVPGAAA